MRYLYFVMLWVAAINPVAALTVVSDPIGSPQATHCRAFIYPYPQTGTATPVMTVTEPLPASRACSVFFITDTLAPGKYRVNAASVAISPTATGLDLAISGRSNSLYFTVKLAVPKNLILIP